MSRIRYFLLKVIVQWIPELQQHCPNATLCLVGLKSDLLSSKALSSTEIVQAEQVHFKLKAYIIPRELRLRMKWKQCSISSVPL
jgi:hypothetical protein